MNSEATPQAIESYSVNSTQKVLGKLSTSPVCFITFMISATESRTAKFYLILPKYCKIFDLSKYIFFVYFNLKRLVSKFCCWFLFPIQPTVVGKVNFIHHQFILMYTKTLTYLSVFDSLICYWFINNFLLLLINVILNCNLVSKLQNLKYWFHWVNNL